MPPSNSNPKRKEGDNAMKKETVDEAVKVMREVSNIVLGKKKDGTPRSIVDAKIKLEKSKRKNNRNKKL